MSTEKMLEPSVAYKQDPLLDDVEVSVPRCRRQRSSGKLWLWVLVIGVLVAMVLMFLGGYYAGHRERSDSEKSRASSKQYYNINMGNGKSLSVPALQGNRPAEEFVQCRSVSVNGQSVCMPSNPIVTAKGTIMLTVYQYNGSVSLIVTGNGENYGEGMSSSPRTARDTTSQSSHNLLLHLPSFEGVVNQPTADAYHRDLARQRFSNPTEVRAPFSYNNFGSQASILYPNEGHSGFGFYMEHNGTSRPKISVADGLNGSHHIFHLPTKSNRWWISRQDQQTIDPQNNFDKFLDPTPITTSDTMKFTEDPHLQVTPDISDIHIFRRSLGSLEQSAQSVIFQILDPNNVNKALTTIRMIRDDFHGGENGTVVFDVTNHTAGCRAQFSTLFHQFLTNGESLENATHHQTYVHHLINSSGHHLSIWQAITPFLHPDASMVWSLVGEIPSLLPCVGSEIEELMGRLKLVIDKMGTTLPGRKLLWKCGFWDTVKGGYDCAHSGYNCYSGVKNSNWNVGKLFGAGKTCIGAGESCYGLVHNCW